MDEAGVGENMQVLGDRLARDGGAGREPGDRLRAAGAEAVQQREPRLVAERREERRRVGRMSAVLRRAIVPR